MIEHFPMHELSNIPPYLKNDSTTERSKFAIRKIEANIGEITMIYVIGNYRHQPYQKVFLFIDNETIQFQCSPTPNSQAARRDFREFSETKFKDYKELMEWFRSEFPHDNDFSNLIRK